MVGEIKIKANSAQLELELGLSLAIPDFSVNITGNIENNPIIARV